MAVGLLLFLFALVASGPSTAAERNDKGKPAATAADKAEVTGNVSNNDGPSIVTPKAQAPAAPGDARTGARKPARGSKKVDAPKPTAQERELAIRDGKRGATQREMMREKRLLPAEQKAAGRRLQLKHAQELLQQQAMGGKPLAATEASTAPCDTDPTLRCGKPGGAPDYFSTTPNWGYSPLPKAPIARIDVLYGGGGYDPATTQVVVEDAYGTGSGAVATIDGFDANGGILGITVTGGTDYTAPVVTVVDPNGGADAVVQAVLDTATPGALKGGLRKFVDTLPGLGPAGANNFGEFIPVAVPDTVTYPGSDYYEIEVTEYRQLMHSDLCTERDAAGACTKGLTTLRGYRQLNNGTDADGANTITPPARPHYLGPVIVGTKDRPVRILFRNNVPTGPAGNLFVPVDVTVMGAGVGPDGTTKYTQNRAGLHLHGGRTPWISDGTAHQWFTPAGETTPYPKGESLQNVPDMPDPGPGAQTIYYTNQQSSRMLFYHDHASGITRLNVYVGEAAGYVLTDATEQALIADQTLPDIGIPLVIQTKTFVDPATIDRTDPTWNSGTGAYDAAREGLAPVPGDLWWPHVYMPAENPYDITGVNATGRWVYGPWFWPPTPVCDGVNTVPPGCIKFGPVANPWYQPECTDPANAGCTRPWEPPQIPGTPDNSWAAEAFLDTPIVNGVAYPTLTLDPKAYRFRVLSADHDRMFNLQLYVADPAQLAPDGRLTEVKMVPAVRQRTWPAYWPGDAREGGVPDPTTAGPDWILIGSEGGFVPSPVVIKQKPIVWNMDPTTFNFGNIENGALMLAPAERADVIVDFSRYAGKTLILYNDAPAPWPALDPHYDYYTNDPDNTGMGGAPSTLAGYGPNTRTIMRIVVNNTTPAPAYDLARLKAAFKHDATRAVPEGVFERSQEPVIVGQSAYDTAYGVTFPKTWPYWGIARISDVGIGFQTVEQAKAGIAPTIQNFTMSPKAIHDEMGGVFDEYGRLSAKLGLEILGANAQTQNFVMQGYADPTTEILNMSPDSVKIGELGDGTQIWKLTHNGVDTHPIHFHLMDVQVLNRVGWDGFIRLPFPEELGWKETVRVSPLEDTIVAMRPVLPKVPFGLPNSERHLNPALPHGSEEGFTNLDPTTGDALPAPTTNQVVDFGWEYTWHCHILSHEENDMMRPISFVVPALNPAPPTGLASAWQPAKAAGASTVVLSWVDATPAATSLGDLSGEIGFKVLRSDDGADGTYVEVGRALANATSYSDPTAPALPYQTYYKVAAYNATKNDAVSAAVAATNLNPPVVTAVAPALGPAAGGTVVALTGTDFVAGATVAFGTHAAATVTFVDSTRIEATTAAAPEVLDDLAVDVAVTNPDGKTGTLAGAFTYVAPPQVLAVDPLVGEVVGGTPVTVSGRNFKPGATLTFGGAPATDVAFDATTHNLTAVTPAGSEGPADVVVTNPDQQSGTLAGGFLYRYSLRLTGLAPNAGPMIGGTPVTLTGTGFEPGAVVLFGDQQVTPSAITLLEIRVTAPASATAGAVPVSVRNPDGGVSPALPFTYVAPPAVAAVSPAHGPILGGTVVTITGERFAAGASVAFGGKPATGVSVVNDTTLTATTPANPAGVVDVVVTNADTQSGALPAAFTYDGPPVVASIDPQAGPNVGATPITVRGTGFQAGASVALGGAVATNASVSADGTTITAVTAPHANGTVDVVVTNPDTQSGTLAGAYRYNDLDLVVSALAAPTGIGVDVPFTVGDTVQATGSGTTPATVTNIYLSPTNVLGPNAILLGSRSVASIRANGRNTGTITVRIPAGTAPGNYFIVALADATSLVVERNDTNNTLASALAVGPDLTISRLQTPNRARPNTAIAITDTTNNPSQATAPASVTAFYLSVNTTYEPGVDIFLASRPVPELPARQSSQFTTNAVVPAGTAPGNYYIIAVADNAAAVPELNETNNTRANQFQVQ